MRILALITGLTISIFCSTVQAEPKGTESLGIFLYGDSAIADFTSKDDSDPVAYRYEHTRCRIYDYYQECETWSCEPNGSVNLSQNFSCVLVSKYACDVGIDCDEDSSVNTKLGSSDLKAILGKDDTTTGAPTCYSVSECNIMISDCISVGGDFVPGTYDPKTGAPSAGYCRL